MKTIQNIFRKHRKLSIVAGCGLAAIILVLSVLFVNNKFSFLSNIFLGSKEYYYVDAGLYMPDEKIDSNNNLNLLASSGVILRSDNLLRGGALLVDLQYTNTKGSGFNQVSAIGGIIRYNPDELTLKNGLSDLSIPNSTVDIDKDLTTILKDSAGKEKGLVYFLVRKKVGYIQNGDKFFTIQLTTNTAKSEYNIALDTIRMVALAADNSDASIFLDSKETPGIVARPLVITKAEERIERTEQIVPDGKHVNEDYFDGNGRKLRTVIFYYDTKGRLYMKIIRFPDGREEKESYIILDSGTIIPTPPPLVGNANDPKNGFTLVSDDGIFEVRVGTGAVLNGMSLYVKTIDLVNDIAPKGFTSLNNKGYEVIGVTTADNKEFFKTINPLDYLVHMPAIAKLLNKTYNPTDLELYYINRTDKNWLLVRKLYDIDPSVTKLDETPHNAYRAYSLGIYAVGGPTIQNTTPGTNPGTTPGTSSGTNLVTNPPVTSTGANLITTPEPIIIKPSPNSGLTPIKRECIPADPFTDISGHWGEHYIESARIKCIIGGKRPGIFEPNTPITRAELTKIVVNAFDVPLFDEQSSYFSDVDLYSWYSQFVSSAYRSSMVEGYSDGKFHPNQYINRAEALKIILAAGVSVKLNQPKKIADSYTLWRYVYPDFLYVFFKDVDVHEWYAPDVFYGENNGIIEGYTVHGVQLFKPGNNITRAEAVKIIMEMIKDL